MSVRRPSQSGNNGLPLIRRWFDNLSVSSGSRTTELSALQNTLPNVYVIRKDQGSAMGMNHDRRHGWVPSGCCDQYNSKLLM